MHLIDIDLTAVPSARELTNYSKEAFVLFLKDIEQESEPANKFMKMFMVLQGLQRDEFALEMQRCALAHRKVFRLLGPQNPALRLLAIVGPGTMEHNTPLDFLLYGRNVQLDYYYVTDASEPWDAVPSHDVAFLAMGESSDKLHLHQAIDKQRTHWPRPFLNNSPGILNCARDKLYPRLNDIPGVLIPSTKKISRAQLNAQTFPFLVRPLDTHGGRGLAKLADAMGLAQYLQARSESDFYVSDFVESAGVDACYRKIRIALIDQQPYVCHLAISNHWLVNYQSAEMQLSAAKRSEEQAFMDNFDAQFITQHGTALQLIARAINLDYVVVDCAQALDGRLLVFEADSGAWIHDTDATGIFSYKATHMAKAFDAFEAMLHRAARHATQI